MAAEMLKLDLALIDVVELPLFSDSYPGHEFSRHLCDSTPCVLARRARYLRPAYASFWPVFWTLAQFR